MFSQPMRTYLKQHRKALIVSGIFLLAIVVLGCWFQTILHRQRHSVLPAITHREMVREAGRQLKEELSARPESGITSRTTEAQILVAYGRLLKEKQQLKIENAMLKGDLTATAEAKNP